MILKASTRGTPLALGRHLLNEKDNDHVELHSVRGFVSDDLMGAMQEIHAMSAGIKSKQPLFSVALSPPARARVAIDVFEAAIAQIEERHGLSNQPRMVVFHEKDGRRHAHAVWSRIEAEHARVIPLPFFKQKLFELSKEIYLEQGWDLPKGFIDRRDRDPRHYDLATYQQAKREGLDPLHLKTMTQEAWAVSKGKDQAAFMAELEKRGLYLAKGDRRSHVVMTWGGEIHSLPRLLDRKTKEVRERLGHSDELRSLDEARGYIRTTLEPVIGRMKYEADQNHARAMAALGEQRQTMKAQHQLERLKLDTGQKTRQEVEARERAERLRTGMAGLWDRFTGRYRQIKQQNDREAYETLQRDRTQRQAVTDGQLTERLALQNRIVQARQIHAASILELHRDLERLRHTERGPENNKSALRLEWLRQQQRRPDERSRPTPRQDRESERGHDLER